MKITHVIESGGGSADFILYLIKYLPQHHHTVICGERTFGNKFEEVKQIYNNAIFYKWEHAQREVKIRNDIKAIFSLYKLIKNIKSDIIHVHSSKAGILGRFVCFLLSQKNVLYTPHGLAFIRKDISLSKMKIYLLLEKIANLLCGKIICCSKSEAEELMKRGINCIYINNGTELFNYIKKKNPSKKDSFVITTVGRVTIQKNPMLFNEIAKYFENDSRFQFVWIGGGELEHNLTSINIKVTGWLDKLSLTKMLADADLYISTASWEGLPFAVIEAMNLHKALLLSNCVGNVDLVTPNYNGFIYNTPEDAINKIIFFYNNKEKLEEYGNNSYALAEKEFNIIKMAHQYENEYKKSANEI